MTRKTSAETKDEGYSEEDYSVMSYNNGFSAVMEENEDESRDVSVFSLDDSVNLMRSRVIEDASMFMRMYWGETERWYSILYTQFIHLFVCWKGFLREEVVLLFCFKYVFIEFKRKRNNIYLWNGKRIFELQRGYLMCILCFWEEKANKKLFQYYFIYEYLYSLN